MDFYSKSPEQTKELGKLLSKSFKIPGVIGFSGELGAGKTELVRAIISGFGVSDSVSSPTYVIEQQYEISGGYISHWDLYRLNSSDSFLEIAELQLSSQALVFIEWPSRVARVNELLDIKVQIDFESNDSDRRVSFEALTTLGNEMLPKKLFL